MHLNDSFGHCEGINCIYNHHEQACSMAAEAYYRVSNRIAGVCVTSGPGAINALNGVVGAFQDSIALSIRKPFMIKTKYYIAWKRHIR